MSSRLQMQQFTVYRIEIADYGLHDVARIFDAAA